MLQIYTEVCKYVMYCLYKLVLVSGRYIRKRVNRIRDQPCEGLQEFRVSVDEKVFRTVVYFVSQTDVFL